MNNLILQIAFVDDVLRMSANIWERNHTSLRMHVEESVEKVRQSCLVVICENEGTKGSAFIPYSVISFRVQYASICAKNTV